MLHGGINGYTRVPVYLKVATNNKADTVLDALFEAVARYGLPSRVCADYRGCSSCMFHAQTPRRKSRKGVLLWVEVCTTRE